MKQLLLLLCFEVGCMGLINAQPPTITSFTPANARPGDAVTIAGNNFNSTAANNVVFFGATRATVTAATATSLTVTVPSGATYAHITLLNTGTGLTCASLSNFNPVYSPPKTSIGSNDFDANVEFVTGSNTRPSSVAIGDLDGDGKPDLAVVNSSTAANTISVFRNTATSGSITAASFAAQVDFATGSGPQQVAIGDIDGDGKPELVVANQGGSTVSVFRNTAVIGSITAASFAPKADFAAGGRPFSVAIGDIDGDGKPDLAVANQFSDNVSILLNTSATGNISFAAKADFATGDSPQSVAIGDIDGDGKPDVATANYNSDNLSVLRNTSVTGAINFTAKADFTAGDGPYSIAIGDIDGDGKPDVAIANDGSSDVSLFRNTSVSGSINFDAKADFATNLRPKSVAFGDIDGDAKPDVVVAAIGSSNSLSVFRNTSAAGSINLAAKADFAAGSGPYSVAIGDLDGDGRPDLASANTNITPQNNYTVSVLRNADIVPSISVTGNLTGFVTCTAIESAEQSITVNGNNLTADITVAAPTGFEVSTTSGNGFGSSVMLTQTAGTVSGTTVYVRLSATATGTPAGNLTIESTGATTQNKAVSGIVNTGTFTATAQGACDSYTWSANNQTYTASGTYIYNYNNDNGCASADTLYLTINTGTFNSTTASACNSYIWVANGITYTTGGIYIYNYNNANGCASADTLKLTLASDNPEICNGIDDNCNGLIDEGLPTTTYYLDADGDGYGTGTGAEYCSNPGAGFATQGGDCNDNDNTVYPNAPERCDSKDNNCNGQIDEDCFASKISINDVSITEGNLKQKTLRFTVSLSDTSSITIKVNYATQNVTATAPGDYVAQSGTLTFAPGKLKRNIKILINGDKTVEPNETFNVVLSNPVNANITKATGTGTILNNDGAAIAATAPTSSDAVIETNAVIMPNPASSISNVKLKGFSGLVTVQLINVQGKTLLQQKLQTDEKFGSQIQLNVSNIPNGLYFISIIDNKGTHRTEKLIVQH